MADQVVILSMKLILVTVSINAVAAKRNLPDLNSKAIDLGQLVHMLVAADQFAISIPFDYRSSAAQWRDRQKAATTHYHSRHVQGCC